MLLHDDIHLLSGPLEYTARTLDKMPLALQSLAVSKQHPMSCFALYMPIKKWLGFNVYDK